VTVRSRTDQGIVDLMPMRTECKNFESRTYPNGDTVRKCNLDLAPDAPWRCPDDCAGYQRRLADQAWTHGSLIVPPTPPEPDSVADGTAAALLDEAEDILNAAGDRIMAEVSDEQLAEERRSRGLRRFLRRRREP
jgi:hypothetical protein